MIISPSFLFFKEYRKDRMMTIIAAPNRNPGDAPLEKG